VPDNFNRKKPNYDSYGASPKSGGIAKKASGSNAASSDAQGQQNFFSFDVAGED